jgi:hypothetical protein
VAAGGRPSSFRYQGRRAGTVFCSSAWLPCAETNHSGMIMTVAESPTPNPFKATVGSAGSEVSRSSVRTNVPSGIARVWGNADSEGSQPHTGRGR